MAQADRGRRTCSPHCRVYPCPLREAAAPFALPIDASLSGRPPFLVDNPGLNSGFMIAHVNSAAQGADLLGALATSPRRARAHGTLRVMTRRTACPARLQVLREACTLPGTRQGLLLAVRGARDLPGASPARPEAGEGLCWHDADRSWPLQPLDADAAQMAVLIEAVPP